MMLGYMRLMLLVWFYLRIQKRRTKVFMLRITFPPIELNWFILPNRAFISLCFLKKKMNYRDQIFTGKDIAIFYPELATPA